MESIAFKHYLGTGFSVKFSPKLCIHAAECVRGLPDVFKPSQKPWIQLEHAELQSLAAVIAACPSGALQLEAANLIPQETVQGVTFHLVLNGPIFVRGEFVFPNTNVRTTRFALCRCGNSNHKPFCDNAHLQGFKAPAAQLQPDSSFRH
jgi:uncharacterized Fe-S cluster protein YjdI/CDGSH-type Zn-finger protein